MSQRFTTLLAAVAVLGAVITGSTVSAGAAPVRPTAPKVVFVSAADYAVQFTHEAASPNRVAAPAYTIYCTLKPGNPYRSGAGVYAKGQAQCTAPPDIFTMDFRVLADSEVMAESIDSSPAWVPNSQGVVATYSLYAGVCQTYSEYVSDMQASAFHGNWADYENFSDYVELC